MNITKQTKIEVVITPTNGAAGTTTINSSAVDHQGDGGILFLVQMGVIASTAVTSIKCQGSDDNSSWSDLTGTAQTIADTDDDKLFYVDLVRPIHRYNRVVALRGTANATVQSAIAIQYGLREKVPSHGATVAGELHLSEPVGTA